MVLNKIRSKVEPLSTSLGVTLGRSGISADLLTLIGFLFALLAGVLYATHPSQPYLAATSIIVSGIMDLLDGAVARAMKKISKRGAFTDSTLDRLAEIAIYGGVIYSGYGINPAIVLLALGFSLLVSYLRAKGESLGIVVSGVGVGERAERLVVLIIFSVAGYVWIGVLFVLIIAAVTFFHRYIHVIRSLGGAQAKIS